MGRLQWWITLGVMGILIPLGANAGTPPVRAQGAPPPRAAAPSGAQAELAALASRLKGADLPDAELVLRLAEAVERYLHLDRIYGPRHPTLQAAHARVTFLRRAVERSPAAGAQTRQAVARGLHLRAVEVAVERIKLGLAFGPRHPRMVALTRRLRTCQQLAQAAGAPGAATTGAAAATPPSHPTWVVSLAEQRGRLRYLRTHFGERHPRVRAASAALVRATQTLRRLRPTPGLAGCRAQWAAYTRGIARLRGAFTASHADAEASRELDAALDQLLVERAALRRTAGCPEAGR